MTTNIIATIIVTLITNVVTSNNAVYEPDYSFAYATLPATYAQRLKTPATEQYLTTNVTERVTIQYEWNGEKREYSESRLIKSVTAIQRLKQAWESAGVRTNDVAPMTNYIRLQSW